MFKDLAYCRPTTVAEAIEALKRPGSRALAGGTDLVVRLREGREGVTMVVDLSGIRALGRIGVQGEEIFLGSMVTLRQIMDSALLRHEAPLLARAAAAVGSPRIRNRGTIGGNIMNASPAGDTLPALLALEASVILSGPGGERRLPLAELLAGPYRTRALPGEFLTEIRFPRLPAGHGSSFLKLGRRNALAVARINVAAVLQVTDKRIRVARLAAGAVTPVPRRFPEAEALLLGAAPGEEAFHAAAREVAAGMVREAGQRHPLADKIPVVEALVLRALREAGDGHIKPGSY
ncbi:nicotinate dehydrogenase FAD-subunit [Moorella thermoacetica]|uniref:Nicotinate dehydrogenase FAD-subunit n=1 Tax=Neomoorella thermoacetica TaxID=1525 RepID=A0A1J5NIJ7_NEOTH|nr:nicotinate dehydrogenase FAD-subunit [Moorella thermoacetica]